MRNKRETIAEILNEHELDILCITETWLVESDVDIIRASLPKTHAILQVPRSSTGQRGGGVAVVYSVSFLDIRSVNSNMIITSFEFMEVTIKLNRHVVGLVVVYRPGHPGTDRNFMEEFGLFLEYINGKHGKHVICGDFNYWVESPSLKPYSAEFCELIDLNNFTNHVLCPTHISGHTLDLVLSPLDSDFVRGVDVVPVASIISDHDLVTFDLPCPRPQSHHKIITFRNYGEVDQALIARETERSLSLEHVSTHSAEELVEVYNDFYRSIQNQYFPEIVKRIRVRDDSPWYDSTVASLRRERRRAERQWRRLRTDLSRSEYVAAKRAVVSRVATCKTEYYRGRIASCGGDQKRLYAILNTLLGKGTCSSVPSHISGDRLASEFAAFFDSKITRIRNMLDEAVYEDLSVDLVPHFELTLILSCFNPVGVEDVLRYTRELNKTFCELDPINVSKIPLAYESAAGFVAEIINHSFSEEVFVASEKHALVHPLIKKDGLDIENLANYRPVSNLSFLSKIMERALLAQLLPLFKENKVIPTMQSAYRGCHSTETALCKIHDDLVVNTCDGKSSVLVLLDLSAAFDTIDHQMLLDDLWIYGVRDSALSLLKSYLTDRSQTIVVGGSKSAQAALRFGVPQGSVLGPVLFSVYIGGLVQLLEAHGVNYHFYADDTQFYLQVENVDDTKGKISSVLSDIKIWMTRRKLKLNDGKSEIIIIHGNMRAGVMSDFGYLDVSGAELSPAEHVRNLGVLFEPSLDFERHINLTVRNSNYYIRNLYAVKKYLDRQSLVTLVCSLVLSRIDYCNSLLIGLPKYLLRKIQSILNRAARLVYSAPPGTPTTALLIELHWLPVKARIEYKLCLLTHKILKFGEPKYLADLLSFRTNNLNVALRSADDPSCLDEPRAVRERSFAARSFSYTAPRLYNRLPQCIRQSGTVDGFKRQLKTFLFSRAYDQDGAMTEEYRV